jgi:chromosome segregation ATPase
MSTSKLLTKAERDEIAKHEWSNKADIRELLASHEAVDALMVNLQNELNLLRSIYEVKESQLIAAGELLSGFGYTGPLNYESGKKLAKKDALISELAGANGDLHSSLSELALTLERHENMLAEKDARIAELESALKIAADELEEAANAGSHARAAASAQAARAAIGEKTCSAD